MQQVEMRVEGQTDKNRSNWLGAMTITHTKRGETVLRQECERPGSYLRAAVSSFKPWAPSSIGDAYGTHALRNKEVGQM